MSRKAWMIHSKQDETFPFALKVSRVEVLKDYRDRRRSDVMMRSGKTRCVHWSQLATTRTLFAVKLNELIGGNGHFLSPGPLRFVRRVEGRTGVTADHGIGRLNVSSPQSARRNQ